MGNLTVDMLKKFKKEVSKNKFDPFKEKEVVAIIRRNKMKQITKKELQQKYNKMKNTELAKELGISEPTLRKLLKQAGIKMKGSGNHKIEII